MSTVLGARLRKRLIKVGSSLVDAGNTTRIRIPPSYLLRRLYGRLVGSINISVAGTVKAEAPLQLISKLSLIADGGRTIFSAAPRDLFRIAHHECSKQPELVPPSGTGSAVATVAEIPLFFEAVRRAMPADSLFDSSPYSDLQLEITWANLAAIYTGGTATLNATTYFELMVEDTVEGHDQVKLIKRISYIDQPVTATQTDLQVLLPKSGLVDKIMIRSTRDDTPVDDLINKVSFQFDDAFDVYKEIPWAVLQNVGVKEYSVDLGASNTGRILGYALLDPVENGRLTSAPNLRGMSDPKLKFDVTRTSGTEMIRITIVSYEPIATTAAAAA